MQLIRTLINYLTRQAFLTLEGLLSKNIPEVQSSSSLQPIQTKSPVFPPAIILHPNLNVPWYCPLLKKNKTDYLVQLNSRIWLQADFICSDCGKLKCLYRDIEFLVVVVGVFKLHFTLMLPKSEKANFSFLCVKVVLIFKNQQQQNQWVRFTFQVWSPGQTALTVARVTGFQSAEYTLSRPGSNNFPFQKNKIK